MGMAAMVGVALSMAVRPGGTFFVFTDLKAAVRLAAFSIIVIYVMTRDSILVRRSNHEQLVVAAFRANLNVQRT